MFTWFFLFFFQMHNGYVFKYWFCELLCFINIVGQLFLIDRFLGGEFLTYGPRVSFGYHLMSGKKTFAVKYLILRITYRFFK